MHASTMPARERLLPQSSDELPGNWFWFLVIIGCKTVEEYLGKVSQYHTHWSELSSDQQTEHVKSPLTGYFQGDPGHQLENAKESYKTAIEKLLMRHRILSGLAAFALASTGLVTGIYYGTSSTKSANSDSSDQDIPTSSPTPFYSQAPSPIVTVYPTPADTYSPTQSPTSRQTTVAPTQTPTPHVTTTAPTPVVTLSPTQGPTSRQTTAVPTQTPTPHGTTGGPTPVPTVLKTANPTPNPTPAPTPQKTDSPTANGNLVITYDSSNNVGDDCVSNAVCEFDATEGLVVSGQGSYEQCISVEEAGVQILSAPEDPCFTGTATEINAHNSAGGSLFTIFPAPASGNVALRADYNGESNYYYSANIEPLSVGRQLFESHPGLLNKNSTTTSLSSMSSVALMCGVGVGIVYLIRKFNSFSAAKPSKGKDHDNSTNRYGIGRMSV